MSKTTDIENKIKKQELVDRINKSIEKRREKYNETIKYLDAGFDITIGVEILDKKAIERRKIEERNKFYDFLEKQQNKLVDIDSDIYESKEKEEKYERTRTYKQRKLNLTAPIVLGASLLLTVGIGTAVITNKINEENEIKRKVSTYSEDIDNLIDTYTYTRIGNLVYQNGEVVEILSEDQTSDNEYQWVDTNKIARYIESCENPDLAAFTLYRDYGKSELPRHNLIVTNTFKTLEFEGSVMGSDENYLKYLNENGYKDAEEYYKACKKELTTDGDSKLDNIKLTLKKND